MQSMAAQCSAFISLLSKTIAIGVDHKRCIRLPSIYIREFKIYDATVAKTSLKIASSSLSVFFVIISVCVTFES